MSGHDSCSASLAGQEEKIGQCYNELECIASGGQIQGYCQAPVGSNILVSQSSPGDVRLKCSMIDYINYKFFGGTFCGVGGFIALFGLVLRKFLF